MALSSLPDLPFICLFGFVFADHLDHYANDDDRILLSGIAGVSRFMAMLMEFWRFIAGLGILIGWNCRVWYSTF